MSRCCGQSQPELEASPGHRRGEKHAKLLHLWNETLSLCTVSAAAVVIKLTLTPATGYIYEIIPFISDPCRKALITVRRRLINLPHVKYSHSAAMKHVAAKRVDSPGQWSCVTGKTGRGKISSSKGIEKHHNIKHRLCVLLFDL